MGPKVPQSTQGVSFGSIVAAWNLILKVIFPKGDGESIASGFRERRGADSRWLINFHCYSIYFY